MIRGRSINIKRMGTDLDRLTKSLEECLECQILQTKILQNKASKKKRIKNSVREMTQGTRPIRVLVADSKDAVYNMAKNELGQINGTSFEVSKAVSYEQVVSVLQDGRFDVVLIDCLSMGDNAIQLAKESKKQQDHAPIIMYGPKESHDCDMLAMEAGAADYLTEDEINPKRLEKAIRYCLSKSA